MKTEKKSTTSSLKPASKDKLAPPVEVDDLPEFIKSRLPSREEDSFSGGQVPTKYVSILL
jgi:hypothetical protein